MTADVAPLERDVPSYVKFLPHHSVDPEGNVVLLASGDAFVPDALGIAWRIGQIGAEARSDGEVGGLAARLDNLLANLPDGCMAQFILRSSRNVRPKLDAWEASTCTDDPILRELAQSRRSALEKLSVKSGPHVFETRSLEGFFTLLRPGSWGKVEVAPLEALADPSRIHERLVQAYLKDRTRILELARTLESLMTQAALCSSRLGEDEVAQLLYAVLNPLAARTLSVPPARPGIPLRERASQAYLGVDLETGLLALDDLHAKVVTATLPPALLRAGMLMRSAHGATFLDVATEMDLVLDVSVPDQETLRLRFGGHRRLATNQVRDKDQAPTLGSQAQELVEIERELAAGKRVVSFRLHAVVRGRTAQEAADRARDVRSALQTLGFSAIVEGPLAGSLFLQCLPFGYRPESDGLLRRNLPPQVTLALAHLLPVYGSFAGTPAPTQLLLNRRGEPVFFSLFNGKEVPHALVSGKSGGGKSVFGNDLIANGRRAGGRFFVLDCGGSYEKLTRTLDGTYVSYAQRNPPRLNPCGVAGEDGSCPPETNSFLRDWLTEMATRGQGTLGVRDQNLLSMAVRKAFAAKPGKEVFLGEIHDALRSLAGEHPGAKDLAVCLSDYVKDGPYARLFDGPNGLDFSRPLVAIDLAGAALEKAVQSVLVMGLMYGIAQAAKTWLTEDKYLLIDEAWTLLKSPSVQGFIENVARTARKHRLALVVLSQQITDLDGETGRAILAQMSTKVCLYQDPDAIPAAARLLQLSSRETELFKTLRTVPGTYSELFLRTPYGSGVARLVLDPLTYWIMTSDMGDRKLLDTLLEKARTRGLSEREGLRQALLEAALRFPRGAPTR